MTVARGDSLQQGSPIWYGARALRDWIRLGGRPQRRVPAHALRLWWHASWFESNWAHAQQRLASVPPPPNPLFILGLWRSGTTLVHELLADCTGWCTPRTWQCFHPSTCFLTGAPSRQISVVRPMDSGQISTHGPQEDEFALLLLGEPSVYRGFIDPRRLPECAQLLRAQAADTCDDSTEQDALPRWRSFLQGIGAGNHTGGLADTRAGSTAARLLLKSPNHTFRAMQLARWYPHAQFIWIGRHSGEVLSSNVRMWRAMHALHALWPCPADALEIWLREAVRQCSRVLARCLAELPRERLLWIDFEELRAQPHRTLLRALEFAGAADTASGSVGAARLAQTLARVPIHAGERASLPADEVVQEFEALMAAARNRFGAPGMVQRSSGH